MAQITDPDLLSQGGATAVTDAVFGTPSGNTVTITSAGSGLPSITAGDFFVVRNHSQAVNNGLYQESGGTPSNASITADKVSGANPIAATSEAIDTLGTTGDPVNIFWDVAGRGVYLLEQNGLSADGVLGQAVYSKAMIDWKDDAYLIGNAPFPMLMIDADAGKLFIGQDASGNNSGWNWVDNVTFSIRTRKLLRSIGWSEVDANGVVQATWPNFTTIGAFEDAANDLAYYAFGSDTTVDDTVDFDFAGPVDEAVQAFERLADGAINGGTGVAISSDGRTLTRSDGGNWRTDGFVVGGRIGTRDSEQSTNDGTFLLSAVGTGANGAVTVGTAADGGTGFSFVDGGAGNDKCQRFDGQNWVTEGYFVGGNLVVANATTVANNGTYAILAFSTTVYTNDTVEVATASFTADTGDNAATFGPFDPTGTPDTTINASINNLNAVTLRLRVRDADPTGKTFYQADLASAKETVLSNRIFKFPLSNGSDPKITDVDATVDGSTPYTGMTFTVYSTPQSLGADLVGGPYNFGYQLNANGGTSEQAHTWIQRQLRKTTDIDADADTGIGRALDGLSRFDGDNATFGLDQVGSGNAPSNPQGGGSGVYVSNLAAGSKNTTTMFDNTGTRRSFPVGTPVNLDFNQTIIDDPASKYTLFFDRTIRNTVSDLVITASAGANGTFNSAGANLPASLDEGAGAFVRVSGLTGADAAMNGVYQVTALTSTSLWSVTRYDGTTIATTSSTSCSVDEHPVDSPSRIIVQDDSPADVTGTADADKSFTFDYTGNTQGGRSGGTDAFVVLRAIGQTGAQYAQSSVQQIESGVTLTITLVGQTERNFNNP